MTRAVLALRCACGLALIAAWLLWWAPAVGALVAGRLRFRLALGLGRALAGFGFIEAARRVYRNERVRAGQQLVIIRARQKQSLRCPR